MKYEQIKQPVESLCALVNLDPKNVKRIEIHVGSIEFETYTVNAHGRKQLNAEGNVAIETLILPVLQGTQ